MEAAPRLEEASPRPEDADPDPAQETDTQANRPHTRAALRISCVDDEARTCTYYLPEHDGVRQCIIGYQVCSDNQWGQCVEGIPIDGGSAIGTGASF